MDKEETTPRANKRKLPDSFESQSAEKKRRPTSPGEQWTEYSFLELGGFALLLLGTFAYRRIVLLPSFCYPAEADALAVLSTPSSRRPGDRPPRAIDVFDPAVCKSPFASSLSKR